MNCYFDVLSEDKHGALLRIVGVFASLGLNIDHLSAYPAGQHGFTDVRVRVKGDDGLLRTLCRKLRRIVTVVEVQARLEIDDKPRSAPDYSGLVGQGESAVST